MVMLAGGIVNPANIMKLPSSAMVPTAGLACLILWSCNPQDPSAVRENQKMIAEAVAKASRLEQENTTLKSQVEDLQKQVADATAKAETTTKKASADDDLDKKLAATFGKLRDQLAAMDKKLDVLKVETEKSIALNNDRATNTPTPAPVSPPVAKTNPTPAPPDRTRAAQPPQVKVQPAPTPEPPKSKYDIKLDHPVMGPGGR